jgi:WD40 repeat protein
VSAGEDNTVRLWNTVTGKEQAFPGGHTGTGRTAAVSSDGKTIASGSVD